MRYNFDEIFDENVDGSLTPRRTIRIGGATIGPGLTFRQGVNFSGIDFFQIRGRAIEANEEAGILVIRGYYPDI
jgi:hypothetical protein